MIECIGLPIQKKEIMDHVNLEGEATEMGKWKEKEKQSFFFFLLACFYLVHIRV